MLSEMKKAHKSGQFEKQINVNPVVKSNESVQIRINQWKRLKMLYMYNSSAYSSSEFAVRDLFFVTWQTTESFIDIVVMGRIV